MYTAKNFAAKFSTKVLTIVEYPINLSLILNRAMKLMSWNYDLSFWFVFAQILPKNLIFYVKFYTERPQVKTCQEVMPEDLFNPVRNHKLCQSSTYENFILLYHIYENYNYHEIF